jgi:hypothetical protein
VRLFLTALFLGLAWFAAATIFTSAVSWLASALVLHSRRALPISGLLWLRLLPAAASGLLAAAVFVPAHLLFEPTASNESFGVIPFSLAALGLALLGRAGFRLLRVSATARQLDQWAVAPLASGGGDAFEAEGFPGVSLAGVLRTRILVGTEARAVLTAEELDLAVAHERAHRLSLDNLKRAAMFCAPDLFGWTATARTLEAEWRAGAESQADRRAVAGDRTRAVHLASALVKVARLVDRPSAGPLPPVWSTFHDPSLLERRIRQLVGDAPASPLRPERAKYALVTAVGAAAVMAATDALYEIHRATEALIAFLP